MKPIIGVTPDFNAGDRKEWGGREPTYFCARVTFVLSKNSAASRWFFHSSQTGPRDGASCSSLTDSFSPEAGRTFLRHCMVNVSAIPSES